MECIELEITKNEPISKICRVKSVSRNSHLIIKSDQELKDETFLSFRSINGKEVKNEINRNGLNRRISIPDWAGSIFIESKNITNNMLMNSLFG